MELNGAGAWFRRAFIKLNVEDWSPDTLYYYCEQHSGMGGSGSITTIDAVRVYPTVDDVKALTFGGETETTITGGADADKFTYSDLMEIMKLIWSFSKQDQNSLILLMQMEIIFMK